MMESWVSGVPVHYAEYGSGSRFLPCTAPVWITVSRRRPRTGLGHRARYGRFYPDLPGMGRTPVAGTISSNDDVVDLLLGLIDGTIGDEPFLVIGHSYGGYLARAIADRRPDQAVGLALRSGRRTSGRRTEHEVLVSSADPAVNWTRIPRPPTAAISWSRPLTRFAGSGSMWLPPRHSLTSLA